MASTGGAGWNALLAADGLAQIGGLALFVYGLTTPRPAAARSSNAVAPGLSISPFGGHGATGAILVGAF